jgi:hypothetical protein
MIPFHLLHEEKSMLSKEQPSLPACRAFIMQLHADANVEQGQWHGRVEHVISFRATHFESLDELLTFMVKVLSELEG